MAHLAAPHPRVVVITGRGDAHVAFVERHLRAPLHLIDAREVITGAELSYHIKNNQTEVSHQDEPLTNISGVWFRKPQPVQAQDVPVPGEFKTYACEALNRHAEILLGAFDQATWVSNYFAMLRASNKALQGAVAWQVGFRVPDTVITSSAEVAREFLKAHPRAIAKPLTPTHPSIGGRQHILLTHRIDADHQADLENLHLAPTIFQEAVDVAAEVRAVVVGDQVFAATMASGLTADYATSHIRDNRLGRPQIEAQRSFPADIAELCVAHCRALGLNFGALDLIIDHYNQYWFLENNPNGQWAFVEDATGQPIGRALARLLEGGEKT